MLNVTTICFLNKSHAQSANLVVAVQMAVIALK